MLRTISWIVLTLATCLMLLASCFSIALAYTGASSEDLITPETSLEEVVGDRTVLDSALRGRRGTAASFSAALGTLLLIVILGPYRRGEHWAWWGILVTIIVLSGGILLRVPLVEAAQGASTGLLLLAVFLVGLLIDVGRLKE